MQQATAREALAENKRQFGVVQEGFAPYSEIGEEFLPKLSEFMKGNYDDFLESPDYKFTLAEGEKALGRKQSAAGSRYGGKALKEAAGYAEGLASTQVDSYFNKLFNTVGIGANAAAGTGNAAIASGNTSAGIHSNLMQSQGNTGNTVAGIQSNAGTNLASIYSNQGNTMANIYSNQGNNMANTVSSAVGGITTLAAYNAILDKIN
jgi:hypothetical protein